MDTNTNNDKEPVVTNLTLVRKSVRGLKIALSRRANKLGVRVKELTIDGSNVTFSLEKIIGQQVDTLNKSEPLFTPLTNGSSEYSDLKGVATKLGYIIS